VDEKEDSNSVNEEELMQYYGFTGNFGKFQLKTKLQLDYFKKIYVKN